MKNSRLLSTVFILSIFSSIACGSSNYDAGDDDNGSQPPVVSGSGPSAPDASVPANCDPTATPATNACVVNETLGVFVAPPSGDAGVAASSADGTRGNPFTKMQDAIDAAKTQKKRVYACIGTYAEAITLADGVSIFGDLDCKQNWSVVATHASLKSPASPAVHADEITSPTRIDSLDVIAPDATTPGGSSIAIIANGSPELTVANATIHAGKAMNGADGVEGVKLTNGPYASGQSNATSVLADCGGINGASCAQVHAVAPTGGVSQCGGGPGGSGGIGIGDAVVSSTATFVEFAGQFYQIPGIQASNGNPQPATALTAAGGVRGSTKIALGASGAYGADGSNGASAAAAGAFSATGFSPADGTTGMSGQPGQGGGGGAGYDYVAQASTNFAFGNQIYFTNGPGGGAGGCPGLAGSPGKGGGASIAVIAVFSAMTFDTCIMQSSDGGNGGAGTYGSAPTGGAVGGADNDPGACVACLFQANGTNVPHLGGNGGGGGTSGFSGSGAGGPSIGVVSHGAVVVLTNTTPTIGTAGHGVAAMTSGIKTIPASIDGVAAATQTY